MYRRDVSCYHYHYVEIRYVIEFWPFRRRNLLKRENWSAKPARQKRAVQSTFMNLLQEPKHEPFPNHEAPSVPNETSQKSYRNEDGKFQRQLRRSRKIAKREKLFGQEQRHRLILVCNWSCDLPWYGSPEMFPTCKEEEKFLRMELWVWSKNSGEIRVYIPFFVVFFVPFGTFHDHETFEMRSDTQTMLWEARGRYFLETLWRETTPVTDFQKTDFPGLWGCHGNQRTNEDDASWMEISSAFCTSISLKSIMKILIPRSKVQKQLHFVHVSWVFVIENR